MEDSYFEEDVPATGSTCEGVKTTDADTKQKADEPRTTFDDTLDEILTKIRAEIALEELKRRAPPPKAAPVPKRYNARRAVLNPSLISKTTKPLRICKIERPTPPLTPFDFVDNRRYKFCFAVLPPSIPRCDPIKICRPLNPNHTDPFYTMASIKQEVISSNAMTRSVSSTIPFPPASFCRQIRNVINSFPDRPVSITKLPTPMPSPIHRSGVAEFFHGSADVEDEFVQVD